MYHIIYSSFGGNTKLVVLKISEILKSHKKEVNIFTPFNFEDQNFNLDDVFILASPTYNQGTLDKNFQNLLSQWQKINLKGVKFAVIGLGDMRYYGEYLTESAQILEEFVKTKEGNLLISPLRINGNPLRFMDNLVSRWVEKLLVVGELGG